MNKPLALFEGYGVELEYMLVNKDNLNVMPICDQVLHALTGDYVNECELGEIAVSNELVLHVLEFKSNGPSETLIGLADDFHQQISKINTLLENFNAQLLPTGAHPWMNPDKDTKIWPHEYNDIYHSYNRIFDCRGHGWSNLQSTHLNLPFSNDEEFAKLHTAIRLVLPIIPALSASTPILDGKLTGFMDTRLEYYRNNQRKIPSLSGKVIPEAIFSQQEYQDKILNKIYRDIAPYDTLNILQEEWLNSRGAIARFERNAIEIRIIDIQECPQADIAILALIVAVLKDMIAEKWQSFAKQGAWDENDLLPIFLTTVKDGQKSLICNPDYLQMFGYSKSTTCSARELWQYLLSNITDNLSTHTRALDVILNQGSLAERVIQALKNDHPQQTDYYQVYKQLAQCLASNTLLQIAA
jgi:carboxylate-amine ligase